MQISNHASGSTFFSAYKLANAPQRPAVSAQNDTATTSTPVAATENSAEKNRAVHRDAQLLESAHRSSARTADLIETIPVL